MSVLSVETVSVDKDYVTVTAVVDGMLLIYPPTWNDPAEYVPALSVAGFYLGDDVLPDDESALCTYLDQRELEWKILDTSDYYD